MVDAIDTSVYFKDPSTELGKEYDFNNDGTVDIADYNLALVYLNDGDPENDVDFTKEHLEAVFAGLIEEEEKNQNNEYDEITESNVDKVAKIVTEAICSGENAPTLATNLKQLQDMGKNLTKYIKECSIIAEIYAQKIATQKAELDKIAAEKAQKEEEYAARQDEVEEKTTRLENLTFEILKKTEKLSDDKKEKSDAIIKSCVISYANGEYENQSLQDIICTQLKNANFNVTDLQSDIANSKNLGAEINSVCADIKSLANDIRTCNINYNKQNSEYQTTVTNRNGIVQAAKIASVRYQSGYQKRLDLRDELIEKYYVEGTGTDKKTSENEQVQSLNDFLNNKELEKMTFTDALAVIKGAFDDCGIKIKEEDGQVSFKVPKGHDTSAKNIYEGFVQAIKDNFGVDATLEDDEEDDDGYEDTTTPTLTTIARTDPISFTDGNIKYEFIQDRNADGILNDKSEFLGSESGWAEMELYDTNGDGHISGDELKTLQLVGVNQDNGQFTFKTAEEAGISDIDLNSYKETTGNKMLVNGNIIDGSFSIEMKDGSILTGEQTYDTNRNLDNTYGIVFGSSIEETTEEIYTANNPFMKDFKETVNTEEIITDTNYSIESTEEESENMIANCDFDINNTISKSVDDAEKKKEEADEAEAIETAKEEKIKEQKLEEEKLEEEKMNKVTK